MNIVQQIDEKGWAGPVPVLSPRAVREVRTHIATLQWDEGAAWSKDLAVRDRLIFDLACTRTITDVIRPLLGEEIILWGASVVTRTPGQAHPWHSDLEVWNARANDAISVWIGLAGTNESSSLHFISGSHTIGRSVQEVAADVDRAERTAGAVRELAAEHLNNPELHVAACTDGDAAFFAGGTWHGSLNESEAPRTALLLQYARADFAIRQPDWTQLDWPFRFADEPRPPVLQVWPNPKTPHPTNRIVPPPSPIPVSMWDDTNTLAALKPSLQGFQLPLLTNGSAGWAPFRFFEGHTGDLRKLSAHASCLMPGHCPHPPHAHFDEEILIVLKGRGEVVWASGPDDPEPQVLPCEAGDFHYYPAFAHHTIRNPASHTTPLEYLMFRWSSSPTWGAIPGLLERTQLNSVFDQDAPTPPGRGFHSQLLFEGPTRHLRKLHAHMSWVEPGAGYAAHVDDYNVAIVLIQGTLETLGKTIEAPALLFHPKGSEHGLRAIGPVGAHYLVVEFHGTDEPRPEPAGILQRLVRGWRRLTIHQN